MARFSPVREMARKAIVGRFDSGPRLSDRPVAQMERAAVSYTAGRRFASARAGQVFTLWRA